MKLKHFSLFISFFIHLAIYAQQEQIIYLEKNNTFTFRKMLLPQKVTINYKNNNRINRVKGMLLKFDSSYITIIAIKNKDFVKIHQDSLYRFSYVNHNGAFLIPLILLNTILTFTPYVMIASERLDFVVIVPLLISISSGYLVYRELDIWRPSLQMDGKWSLQSQNPHIKNKKHLNSK